MRLDMDASRSAAPSRAGATDASLAVKEAKGYAPSQTKWNSQGAVRNGGEVGEGRTGAGRWVTINAYCPAHTLCTRVHNPPAAPMLCSLSAAGALTKAAWAAPSTAERVEELQKQFHEKQAAEKKAQKK